MGVDMKTLKRWKNSIEDKRKGPVSTPGNKLSSEERQEVLRIATSVDYMNLPPCQIVPMLADQGRYLASESSFYRILRAEKLLAHRGKSKSPDTAKPTPLVATGPNQIYSWDITYLRAPIKGQYYYLYLFMDIFSRKIVGHEIYEIESMQYSSELIDKICKAEGISRDQLILHADNGGAMKGATMLATLQRLGVIPSFSRPRVSNDNPYSESLFKTLKYRPEYPSKAFNSLEEAKVWVNNFVNWYNNSHLHSGIKFVTPSSRHTGADEEILKNRVMVYESAKEKNKNRWSGEIRNWKRIEKVYLNYLQKEKDLDTRIAS